MNRSAILIVCLSLTLTSAPSAIAKFTPTSPCTDVHEEITGTSAGAPDETVLGTSLEADTYHRDLGSSECRIVQLTASLSTSADPDTNYSNDADLQIDFEGITLGSSQNFGTEESVTLDGVPWGTYTFTVQPWSAVQAPYTLEIDTTLEPDPSPSGDNADEETVVIAVPDTGINPYHDEFAAESYPGSLNLSQHPGTYIEEYPDSAPALELSLDEPYDEAVQRDDWHDVPDQRLHWIPGTKIVGAYASEDSEDNVLDRNGHGTASASVAAGNTLGSCERCLLVALDIGSLNWAMSQPWIDLVSNSYGRVGNLGLPAAGQDAAGPLGFGGGDIAQDTRSAVTRGQTVLFAAGNGMANAFVTPQQTYTSPFTGPDWTLTVGAVWNQDDCRCPGGEGSIATSGKPVDIASYALGNIPAAAHDSTSAETQHSGTSSATPIVAGVMGQALLESREVLGDHVGGTRDVAIAEGQPVQGPHGGMLEDGQLTRAELEEAVKVTAEHTQNTYASVPATVPTFVVPEDQLWSQWAHEGWGVVTERTGVNATEVILGEQPVPDRPLDQQQADIDETNRAALWGDPVAP